MAVRMAVVVKVTMWVMGMVVVWVMYRFCSRWKIIRQRYFVLHRRLLDRVLLCGGPLRGLFARPVPSDADALVVVVARGGDVGGCLGDT